MLLSLVAMMPIVAPITAQASDAPAAVSESAPQIDSDRQKLEAMDAYMQAQVRNDMFSGTALVARDGKPVFVKSYGMANYELSAVNTSDTTYLLGSVVKQLTAVAILQLQEKGKLKVSDPICRYLENCPQSWQGITLHHLLTHTSGIPNFTSLPEWDEKLAMLSYTRPELVALFRDLPLDFAPGEKFNYSNSGYALLGVIIERVSGQRYEQYLGEHIFKPVGMKHSRFRDTRALLPDRAAGYYSVGTDFINGRFVSSTVDLGASGIYSTVGDLLLWDKALTADRLISRASRDAMFTPDKDGYGYGWFVGERHGRPIQFHSGSDNGFSTNISRFSSDRTTVIVLSNSDRVNAGRVGSDLAAIALGAPYKLPVEKLGDLLWNVMRDRGVTAALARHAELKRTAPTAYDFGDETLVTMGYDLFEVRRLAEAKAVFEYNLKQYPKSAYSYDGLADIAATEGDKAEATALFGKSLGIDPENRYAVEALARLGADGAKVTPKP
ncbi:serine hydrolase [Sphingopyxis sp.]|uniref:serine hydrolase n=1 Tax=Sphingopyxis sp. TaxID=1908224 RepID=UPI003D11AE37